MPEGGRKSQSPFCSQALLPQLPFAPSSLALCLPRLPGHRCGIFSQHAWTRRLIGEYLEALETDLERKHVNCSIGNSCSPWKLLHFQEKHFKHVSLPNAFTVHVSRVPLWCPWHKFAGKSPIGVFGYWAPAESRSVWILTQRKDKTEMSKYVFVGKKEHRTIKQSPLPTNSPKQLKNEEKENKG